MTKKTKTTRHAFTISLCAFIMLAAMPSGLAAAPGAPAFSEGSLIKDLGLLEDRFFSRQYANDPTDKRLERLELLVFGATQDGDLEQRWNRLNKSMASRASATAAPKTGSAAGSGDKAPDSSSQYPVLNTLEWRALKQTYPKETMDQRLARMEKKLFGQDSPGMPYIDRVERLRRTLGIGVTAAAPTGPLGPAPKARPRNSGDNFTYHFGDNGPWSGGRVFGDEGGVPTLPGMPGFGMGAGALNGTFAQLFADMNRQMAELEKLGPGAWTFDPKSGMWVEQFSGKKLPRGEEPKSLLQPTPEGQAAPKLPSRSLPFNFGGGNNNMNNLPPYADPNSI